MLDKYTSTGKKFLKHPDKLINYINGDPRTIISSHISPEGSCTLNCSYCSFRNRNRQERIDMDVMKDYITRISMYGCKAITLTGGGEPMLYPDIENLIKFIKLKRLQLGIITNGYQLKRTLNFPFEWLRISINNTPLFFKEINSVKNPGSGFVGFSMIMSEENMDIQSEYIKKMLDKFHARYIRLIPDCCKSDDKRFEIIEKTKSWLKENINDERFLVQDKKLIYPDVEICHQSYFRPFLSEVNGGTVFACDCIGLNNKIKKMDLKYKLCMPHEIIQFLEGKIKSNFNPSKYCPNCAYVVANNMLGHIKKTKFIPETNWEGDHINFV